MTNSYTMNDPYVAIIDNIKTHPRTVLGCKRYNRDVMISYMRVDDPIRINDLFLTQEQAIDFLKELKKTIEENESND